MDALFLDDFLMCELWNSEYLSVIIWTQKCLYITQWILFESCWEAVLESLRSIPYVTFNELGWFFLSDYNCDRFKWMGLNCLQSLVCYRMDKIQEIRIQFLKYFVWHSYGLKTFHLCCLPIFRSRYFWMSSQSMLGGISWRKKMSG